MSAIILNMSVIDLILPLNQLLSSDPPNMQPIPIQRNGNIPDTNKPTVCLFITNFNMLSGFADVISGFTAARPAVTEASIRRIPATRVKILMNPAGVGFVQWDHALSISKALMRNAPPRTLTKTAKISLVIPRTVAIPPISRRIPGTPKKNFEYFESKAMALRYLPNTAYEYSTLLLTRITTLLTDTTGKTF